MEADGMSIRYDPKHPRNAETEHDIGCRVLGRSCSFLVMALVSMYMITQLFVKFFTFDNEWNGSNGILVIIIGVSLIVNCSWFWWTVCEDNITN